jgi:hypothetical protein
MSTITRNSGRTHRRPPSGLVSLALTSLSMASTSAPAVQKEADDFGTGLAALGDVNHDGTEDFAVSDPEGGQLLGAGWVAVVCGRTRTLIWEAQGTQAGERLGTRLSSVGDVDADGTPDLGVRSGGWARPGRAAEHGDHRLAVLSGATGRRILAFPGLSVGPAGDVDGDGHADLLVALPSALDAESGRTTRAVVRSGADGTCIRTLSAPESEGGGVPRAMECGDIDGGGLPDWGIFAGGELVVFLAEDGTAMPTQTSYRLFGIALPRSPGSGPTATARARGTGLQLVLTDGPPVARDREGGTVGKWWLKTPDDSSVSRGVTLHSMGDANGDDVDDYLVGLDVVSMIPEKIIGVGVWSGAGEGMVWRYRAPKEICRTSMVPIGDLNEDGIIDVLVTSSYSIGGPPMTGRVEALSGKTGARIFKVERNDLDPQD